MNRYAKDLTIAAVSVGIALILSAILGCLVCGCPAGAGDEDGGADTETDTDSEGDAGVDPCLLVDCDGAACQDAECGMNTTTLETMLYVPIDGTSHCVTIYDWMGCLCDTAETECGGFCYEVVGPDYCA